MGAATSHGYKLTTGRKDELHSSFPLEDVPSEVLIHILAFVPAKDLVLKVNRVCKAWKELVDSRTLWIEKCQRDGAFLPKIILQEEIVVDLKKICVKKPFNRNLLRNWDAEDGLKYWDVTQNGGDRFLVEKEIPASANSLSEVTDCDVKKCWSTSYGWCSKGQCIDLWEHGCSSVILDSLKPNILVSDWIASRADCGTKYELKVQLLSTEKQVIKEFKTKREEDQWVGRAWTKVEHKFVDYGSGVRYINFVHRGKDRQFWAGHYGAKMAAPCAKLSFPG